MISFSDHKRIKVYLPILIWLSLTILAGNLTVEAQQLSHLQQVTEVFISGEEGYKCFRIPAVVNTQQGDLLAFAEGRKNGCGDAGDIDLVMKRSKDQGQTWSPLQVIWDDQDNTCGNPAPVIDQKTGNILLLSTWNLGTDHEQEIIDQMSEQTRKIFLLKSSDHGANWTAPEEITRDVKQPNWTWYATGPGSGIQIKYGDHKDRLLIACDHIEAKTKHYYSHVIYSDDYGMTWQLGGSSPQHQVNECEVAELADGRLVLNMRNYDRSQKTRQITFSRDGGMTWDHQQFDDQLAEPICQGSLLTHRDQLFFSNPATSEGRHHMTVKSKHNDGGTDWRVVSLLHEGPSAYSDLVGITQKQIGCLYERGDDGPYELIVFQVIELAE